MSFKFSLIILLNEFDEAMIKNCFNSLLNQSFKDIEIICVTTSPSDYLDNLANNDNRFVILNSENNNLKNIGLNYSSGEYVSFIDCTDWIDFDFCEKAYSKAKKDNVDVLIYKVLEYENENLYKNYFYEFFSFDNGLFETTFTFDEIIDSLFTIPQGINNKIYRREYLKENSIEFIENTSFDEMIFFFKSVLNAKKISLLDDYIYFKKIKTSNNVSNNILKDLVEATNSVISVFIENNSFNLYKQEVLNYKLDLIRYWYLMLNDFIQQKHFNIIRDDLLSIDDEEFLINPKIFLSEQNLFFYESFLKFDQWDMINLIYKNNQLKQKFNESIEINDVFKIKISNLNQKNEDLVSKNDMLESELSNLNGVNEDLVNKNKSLDVQISNLGQKNEDLVSKNDMLESELSNLNGVNEDLVNKNKSLDVQISNLGQKNEDLVSKNDMLESELSNLNGVNEDLVNKNKSLDVQISNLGQKNEDLVSKNDMLESELSNLNNINYELKLKLDNSQMSINKTIVEVNEKNDLLNSQLKKQSIVLGRLNEKNRILSRNNRYLRKKLLSKKEKNNVKSLLLHKFK